MIIGNYSVVEFFKTVLAGNSRAQTYAFIGPDQVGKRTLARGLARQLLGCTVAQLAAHPDFHYLERLTEDKTGKLKKDISVEQARNLKSRLGARPWVAKYQVVIINEAELINLEAGNALLKLLEEPPDGTIIFLLSEDDKALLPTIRSRTQLLYFSLVPEEVIVAALVARGAAAEVAVEMARAAWGRPGRALDWLSNPELYQAYQDERARWQRLSSQPFYVRVKETAPLLGDGEEGVRGRERLSTVFTWWEMWWREALLVKTMGTSAPQNKSETGGASQLSAVQLVSIIDRIAEGRRMLRNNMHPGIIMEQILLGF